MTDTGRSGVLSRRAQLVDRSAARATSDAAASLRAAGGDVLELYGAPYWLPPEHVLEAAAHNLHDPDAAHSQGMPALRRAIADRLEHENGIVADPERAILVTNAAMHALYVAFNSLLDPGDEVLVYSPAFYFYGSIELAGGTPVYARTAESSEWAWDAAALAAAVTPRTKLLIVNTPTNPTGYVATRDDLEAVAEIARRNDLIVVSDEAYDHMLYDGRQHLSIAALPGMGERTVTVCSFTKSYAMKQWRLGFLVAPEVLLPAMRKILEWNVLECNHVAQHAAIAALTGPQDWVADISRRMQHCRDVMTSALEGTPGLSFVMPGGGPFLFLNVSALGIDGHQFAGLLLRTHGVPMDAGGPFGSSEHVRLLFGGEDHIIREAAWRIRLACDELQRNGADAA
ncbi:MAG: aminotransferase class I/II-fold pyridoxal phosphate-dependent enzyme [Chloroflexi bacterium]|nr:aminotransferase class I/II-fold pyridoxal phosphate-dependent enzyme [Chloroflexota bacterium]